MQAEASRSQEFRQRGSQLFRLISHGAGAAAERLAVDGAQGLGGDRTVEWAFCFARLADGPGTTLDFGADIGMLGLAAALRGHDVVTLDRMSPALEYAHPRVESCQADILERPLRDRKFDQIINCSSVEHVGLAGRYGSFDDADGDLKAMDVLADMLAADGRMILTIPVGRDMVCRPLHRIYGPDRLPRLLERFSVAEEQYWLKDPARAAWVQGTKEDALATEGSESFYSLGLFVLRPGEE